MGLGALSRGPCHGGDGARNPRESRQPLLPEGAFRAKAKGVCCGAISLLRKLLFQVCIALELHFASI